MQKEMIVSSNGHETMVAILEDDLVAEVFVERERQRGVVGNVYKGRVSKVLPGMQSSFIDLGLDILERNIRRDWNSPSVMCWFLGNESYFTVDYLKEAKAVVDEAPKPIKEAVSREEAERVAEKMSEVGAKVTIK